MAIDKEKKKGPGADSKKEPFWGGFAKGLSELWVTIQKERVPRLVATVAGLIFLFAVMIGFVMETKSPMFDGQGKGIIVRLIDSLYFTVVTMSTVGYGDLSPRTPIGRLFDIFIIFSGVVTISLLTATIASVFVERKIKEGRGLVDLSSLKEHTIICGWKKNMDRTLDDIFSLNKNLKAKCIVIIANIPADTIDLFKQQNPKFKDINFLRGEYFNEHVLMLANIKNAENVFILADESENASTSEVDSKTVMTAMTISTMARNVHICAEILDPKFDTYLHKAHVAEIIYPTQYGRLMLAHSTASVGVVEVINDLLNLGTPNNISTRRIPDAYIGKQYSELKAFFAADNSVIIIGLLENVGSFFERKQEAIREAQKTPDISKLVDNLQKVKAMKNNKPVFNPPDDYVVPRHSMAIIIEVRKEEADG
jgi:voltage-gated potassium channel